MKDKMYQSIAEYANLCMVIIFHQTLFLLGEYAMGVTPKFYHALILAAAVVFCHFTRVKIFHFVPYALLHVAVFAGLFFLPKAEMKIYLIVYVGVLFFLDFVYWTRKGENGLATISVWFVVLNAGAYLYSSIKKNEPGMKWFFILGILFFVLFYIRFFSTNAGKLAKDKSKDERMPLYDMIRNGLGIVLPFLIVSILLMVLVRSDFLDQYIIKAYEIFLQIIGKIIKALIAVFIWLSKLLDKFRMTPVEEAVEEGTQALPDEQSLWVKILTAVLYVLSLIAIFALAVKGIYNLIRMIPLRRIRKVEVVEESDMVEIREKIVRKERRKEVRLPRIRRLYKKRVEKEMRAGYVLEVSHTPKERAKDIWEKRGNHIEELSLKYEKERYSCKAKSTVGN